MSEKPHSLAIGAFVVGALLIILATILFLLGSGFGQREKVIMVFDGSIKGLNVGAPVALRGVQVGQVTKIEVILDSDNLEFIMLVEADLDEGRIRRRGSVEEDLTEELVARGMRAQLNTQSLLTGLLYIELDFYPNTEIKLADVESPYYQFPTIPTSFEQLAQKLQDIDLGAVVEDLQEIAEGVDKLVNSADTQALPGELAAAMESLTALSEELRKQVASTGPKLDTVLDEAAVTVASANEDLPRIADIVEANLAVLEKAIVAFERTLVSVDGLVSTDSATMYELHKALQEMTRAGRSLQSLARTLEEQPEALLRGKSGD